MARTNINMWILFVLLAVGWRLPIDAKAIKRGPSNETLLIGRLHGPAVGIARDLRDMILSITVVANSTILHSSIIPIWTNKFPIPYEVILNDQDFKLEGTENFLVQSTIWQRAYAHDAEVQLPENEVEILDLHMKAVKYALIRGFIQYEDDGKEHEVSGTEVKLELIEEKGIIIDQADFTLPSRKYPIPFTFYVNTIRLKANVEYSVVASIAARSLPARATLQERQKDKAVETKKTFPEKLQFDPTGETIISNLTIIVVDVVQ